MDTGEKVTNDNVSPQNNLEDLNVSEEHAEEAKGGESGAPAGYNTWRTNFGRTS